MMCSADGNLLDRDRVAQAYGSDRSPTHRFSRGFQRCHEPDVSLRVPTALGMASEDHLDRPPFVDEKAFNTICNNEADWILITHSWRMRCRLMFVSS